MFKFSRAGSDNRHNLKTSLKKFLVYYQNCRGIKTKLEDLKLNLLNHNSDIIVLTETWLNSSVYNQEFNTDKIIFRKDRDQKLTGKKQGGGVLIALSKTFTAEQCDIFDNDLEALCVKVRLDQREFFYVVVVYFVPGCSLDFYRRFYHCIETNLLDYRCLILGDFNLRELVLDVCSVPICDFKSFLAFTDFLQINTVHNVFNVLLDLVIVSPHLQGSFVEIGDDPLFSVDQYHPVLSIEISLNHRQEECDQIKNKKFNFKKANFEEMYRLLKTINWESLYTCYDVNECVTKFYRTIDDIFVKCVPMSTQVGRVFPVWFNGEIIKLIKAKQRFFKKFKRTKISFWRDKYREYRQKIKLKIKKAYAEYKSNAELNLYSDPKYFWSFIRNQKNDADLPAQVCYNNISVSGAKNIANMFAQYFGSVFIPDTPMCQRQDQVSLKSYFCDRAFSRSEIREALKKLNGNRSVGPDGVPGYIIKGCADLFVEPLLHIFNRSIQTSTYPRDWQMSKVIPLFKKGAKHEVINYRPVTILNAASKVFEIALFNRLYDEIKHNISECQHGFLPNKSTLTNLITFSQFVHNAFNNKKQVDVIYTDMEKAFDRVKHSHIINSLYQNNVTSNLIYLLQSYLINRQQYVEVRGARSDIYTSTSGVPQGSNLGPLLFLIAINDICSNISNSKTLLFADDFKIYREITSIEDCICLQRDLENVVDWCSANAFKFNNKKCSTMSLTLNRNIVHYNNYNINDTQLQRSKNEKDLGVMVDCNLGFTDHIINMVNEAHKTMGFIVRSTKGFNVECCIRLFDSLVLPRLEYGSIIWSPQYEIWIKTIERVQRKFLKYMFFKKFGFYPNQGYNNCLLLKQFNRLSLENRRIKICLIYIYKILTNRINCPEILSMLPFFINVGNTRQRIAFKLEFPRTNTYKNSPIYRMCNFFNIYASDLDLALVNLKDFTKVIEERLYASQNSQAQT